MNTSEQLSAQESERVIRQLLHLDGSPGSNPNLNSPHATFNAPDNAFQMPPLSPTSPISPSNPSGLLTIACLQNRWPQPIFSHGRTGQHFITTVCVAGKMFPGLACVTIEEATESAARAALTAFFSHAFPMQSNGTISPFAFPPSPNIPLFSLSPTHPPHHSNSAPRHDTSKKKEGTFKSTPGSQDKTFESSKRSSCAESTNKTKTDSSSVHKQNLFIPLQVSLKKNEVVNTSPTKTSKGTDTKEANKPETQETTKPETQEPTKTQTTSESSKRSSCAESTNKTKIDPSSVHKPNLFIPLQVSLKKNEVVNTSPAKTSKGTDTKEANKPETQEPTKPQTREPTKTQAQEPTKTQTQEPTKTQTQEPTKTQTQEPTKPQAQEPTKTQAQEPTKTQTQEPTKPGTQEPTKPETQEPTKTQETQEPTKTQTQEPTKTQETQEPTKTQETQEPTNTQETVKPEEKDTSTTTKPNTNEPSKNDRTSIKNNAGTSTGTKPKPVLLAPSFFTKKE